MVGKAFAAEVRGAGSSCKTLGTCNPDVQRQTQERCRVSLVSYVRPVAAQCIMVGGGGDSTMHYGWGLGYDKGDLVNPCQPGSKVR